MSTFPSTDELQGFPTWGQVSDWLTKAQSAVETGSDGPKGPKGRVLAGILQARTDLQGDYEGQSECIVATATLASLRDMGRRWEAQMTTLVGDGIGA
jgi:hypothetical protein